MKLIFIVLLLSSCGRIKVDDVEVKESTHTVNHRIILEADISLFETKCTEQYPDDVIKQQDCVDGYTDAMNAILDIENMNLPTDTIEL